MELEVIKKSILEIRGRKVILDYELAKLYLTETKRIKESVRRNMRRFPPDFMFELTKEEWGILRTQFATSKRGGVTRPPFAFTEQGVAMLSSVLNSERAVDVNIAIMRAFVLLRQFAMSYHELSEQLQVLEQRYDQKFNDIEEVLKYLLQKDNKIKSQEERKKLGY